MAWARRAIAINGIAPDSNSQFARADKPRAGVAQGRAASKMAAKPQRKPSDWATARGRMLDRGDAFFEPGAALGFRPVGPASGSWHLRR